MGVSTILCEKSTRMDPTVQKCFDVCLCVCACVRCPAVRCVAAQWEIGRHPLQAEWVLSTCNGLR